MGALANGRGWAGMGSWTLPWFGHGCPHGRYHGLGMDALASEWAGSMSVIMVWAWMHWPMDVDGSMDVTMVWAWVHWPMDVDGLGKLPWFGHGCTGQ